MPIPPLPKHLKVRGELAETIFVSAAMRQGFRVSKPYGDSAPYDFIVERGGRMARVQVKATTSHVHGTGYGYSLGTRHCRHFLGGLYRRWDVDFIAGYVFARDEWFLVPVGRIHATSIYLGGPGGWGRFQKYREAWSLLAGGRE